jgi:hypothetical protein
MAPTPVREQPRQAIPVEEQIYKPSEVDTGRRRIGDPKSMQQEESNFLTEDDEGYRGPLKKHMGKHKIMKQYSEQIGGVLSGFGSSKDPPHARDAVGEILQKHGRHAKHLYSAYLHGKVPRVVVPARRRAVDRYQLSGDYHAGGNLPAYRDLDGSRQISLHRPTPHALIATSS